MFVALTCSDLEASIAIILLFHVVKCSSGLSEIVCVALMCCDLESPIVIILFSHACSNVQFSFDLIR